MSKEASPIVTSVYIEKTAGTSAVKIFEEVVGRQHVAFYDPVADSLTRSSSTVIPQSSRLADSLQLRYRAIWPMVKKVDHWIKSKDTDELTVPRGIDAIHGHFSADRFDDLVDNQIPVVVLRDPLERMRSQYDHWQRTRGNEVWRVHTPYVEGMRFEDYAMLPHLQNYQTQALGGKDLTDFAVVGVTEDIRPYTRDVATLLQDQGLARHPLRSTVLPYRNRTPENKRSSLETVSTGFQRDFRRAHTLDYEVYDRAVDMNHRKR